MIYAKLLLLLTAYLLPVQVKPSYLRMVDRGKNEDLMSNPNSSVLRGNKSGSSKQRNLGWLSDLIAKTAKDAKDAEEKKTTKSAKAAKSVAKVVSWDVVVNNADVIPPPEAARRSLEEVEEKTFSSYNAASVNAAKDVVFRARSTG